MKLPDKKDQDGWVDVRIEPYVSQELPQEEVEVLEYLLEQNPAYGQQVDVAFRLKEALNELAIPEVPSHVTRTVLETIQSERRTHWLNRLNSLFIQPAWKPALGALAVVCAVWIVSQPTPSEVSIETHTSADVDQALNEVKYALGLVSQVGREAGASVNLAIDPLRASDEED